MPPLDMAQIRALFAQEAEVRLADLGQHLLALGKTDDDEALIGSIFRELHTIKGSSAVAGLPVVSQVAHELEELVADLRAGRRAATPDLIDTLFHGTDRLAELVAMSEHEADPDVAAPVLPPPVTSSRNEAAVVVNGAGMDDDGLDTDAQVVPLSPASPVSLQQARASRANAGGVVSVPLERLDELTRLVSESASAHLRLGRMLSDRLGTDPASITEFNDLSRSLNDLQDRAMRTQMVAVATITDSLHRAVRDLSRAQGKDIRWEARGTDTELDRGVLHRLSDSLLHMVRNAVDHGIESPAERAAAGKPPQAVVRLHAMQLGSEVIIAITDDGRGVNVDRVRVEADRHGVRTDGLSDDEVIALTLRSGLSTAAFVTDVSGRGVGLDVVRANVESAGGRIEVRSEPGAGAEFRVIVPITLAVLRCLLVEAGGYRYALPFHRVVRSQVDTASTAAHAEGRAVVWVDRQAVPVSCWPRRSGVHRTTPQRARSWC